MALAVWLEISTFVTLCVIGFLSIVFGANRGNHIRRVNTHVAFFFLFFMALWYFVKSFYPWVIHVDAHKVDMARIFASGTVITTFLVLSSYTLKKDALDMLLHFVWSLFIQYFIYLSLTSNGMDRRWMWMIVSFVFSAILFMHVTYEIDQAHYHHVKFSGALIVWVSIYTFVYLCSTIWSPYFQGLIGFGAYNVINDVADILVILFCLPNVVHYSWGIIPVPQARHAPGEFSNLYKSRISEQQKLELIKCYHSF